MAEISSSRIVITVLGKNRPGIVAGVTRVLGEANVDIRDITQSIIEDIFTMTMLVDQKMFPTVSTYIREGNPEIKYMLICVGLALVYWLIFLRTKPIAHIRSDFAEKFGVPRQSGLVDALKVLKDVNGIAQCYFTDKDVVRHRLVQEIVKAYERAAHPAAEAENKENKKNFK